MVAETYEVQAGATSATGPTAPRLWASVSPTTHLQLVHAGVHGRITALDEAPIRRPYVLRVRLVQDQDGYTAIEDQTGMYGVGDRPDDALADLYASLRELQADLEAHVSDLSDGLRRDLVLLRHALPG